MENRRWNQGIEDVYACEKAYVTSGCRFRTVGMDDWTCSHETGVESMVRWSLTSEELREAHDSWIVVFRVAGVGVHVTATHVCARVMDSHEKLFAKTCTPDEIMESVRTLLGPKGRRVFFVPGRDERRSLEPGHVGHAITVDAVHRHFPGQEAMSLEIVSRLAREVCSRWIGVDARRWLGTLSEDDTDADAAVSESLSLAVRADAAMLLRLLVTPADAFTAAA